MIENRPPLAVLESNSPPQEVSYLLNLDPDHGQEIFSILRKAIKGITLKGTVPGVVDHTLEARRHRLELERLSSKFAPLSPEEADADDPYLHIVYLTNNEYDLIQSEGRKRFGEDAIENRELESTLEELRGEFHQAKNR